MNSVHGKKIVILELDENVLLHKNKVFAILSIFYGISNLNYCSWAVYEAYSTSDLLHFRERHVLRRITRLDLTQSNITIHTQNVQCFFKFRLVSRF